MSGEALEIDYFGRRLLTAAAFPEDADIVDDDVLRRGDPEGEIARGFQREGNAVLVPLAADVRLRRLAVPGSDTEGAVLRERLGPEREGVRLSRLEGRIDRQGGAVGAGLHGIIAGEDVVQALENIEPIGLETVQGAGLEVPVLLQQRRVVVPGSL